VVIQHLEEGFMAAIMKSVFFVLLLSILVNCSIQDSTPPIKEKTEKPDPYDGISALGQVKVVLYAGQDIEAGTVSVETVSGNMVVTYGTINGWTVTDVHFWIGETLSGLPQNKPGNPVIGHFPYKAENLGGVGSCQVKIPLSDLGTPEALCGTILYAAAHADLIKSNADGSVQAETGWGAGSSIAEKGNWGTWFSFLLSCDGNGPDVLLWETAFAYGDRTFIDFGLTKDRWGWVVTVPGPGSFTTPIYAGAARNDIKKGHHVGDLAVKYDGSALTVTYNMIPGFVMNETELYASTFAPITIAPGQYGNIHDLDMAATDSYKIDVEATPVYLIAHAIVGLSR
jgi:hypothetical protein